MIAQPGMRPVPEASPDPVATLSTHVLDAVSGSPADGVGVTLERRAEGDGGPWTGLGTATTDDDGRARDFPPLRPGVHRLVFDTGSWFAATGRTGFYPEVAISFAVTEERHYHVPLLLSPFAYSTYRGS
jgi:5-hydroxyisourate hydrolase